MTPEFRFRMKLQRGYYVWVEVWTNRRELAEIAGRVGRMKRSPYGAFEPNFKSPKRLIGTIHLSLSYLHDGKLGHELYHAMRHFERRLRWAYKTEDGLEEAAAVEMERCLLAAQSHIRDEQRIRE